MMKELKGTFYLSPEEKNKFYKEGYRFFCDGNYSFGKGHDPQSGMPEVNRSTYLFDNKEEADAFALTQNWIFNENIHPNVYKIPEHTETWNEHLEKIAREKEEKKAKREANERKKAEAMGLTVEEYKEVKAKERAIKKLEKEIAELEKELVNKKRKLEKIKNGG